MRIGEKGREERNFHKKDDLIDDQIIETQSMIKPIRRYMITWGPVMYRVNGSL